MIQFLPFRFDSRQRMLWRDSHRVPLTPKAAALLDCLLAHRGTWVPKARILSEVWPDTHVQSANIKVLVREIRQALNDPPHAPRYIASVHGLGYAFVAPATSTPNAVAASRPSDVSHASFDRADDLERLWRIWATADAALPRFVTVAGDHGSGKTTLCNAFVQRVRAAGPVRVCVGQCVDRELVHEPCYPILDALLRLDRQFAELVPPLLARYAPSWLTFFPQWSDNEPAAIEPRILRQELKALLEALAADAPLVMILEDLQWADVETRAIVSSFATEAMSSRLLIIGTCSGLAFTRRDARLAHSFDDDDSRADADEQSAGRIDLLPLTVDEIARQVDATFGRGCMPAVAALLHAETGGNAALVCIGLDGLSECGLTTKREVLHESFSKGELCEPSNNDSWRHAPAASTIAVALSRVLSDALAAQLEQLDANERRTVEAAAAVGAEFSTAAVACALECDRAETFAVLTTLARRGRVIVAHGTTDRFRFRHRLYVDVIAERAPLLRQHQFARRLAAIRQQRRRA